MSTFCPISLAHLQQKDLGMTHTGIKIMVSQSQEQTVQMAAAGNIQTENPLIISNNE